MPKIHVMSNVVHSVNIHVEIIYQVSSTHRDQTKRQMVVKRG